MSQRNNYRPSVHRGIDDCRVANEGPRGGLDDRELYLDYDPNGGWTITGTWGAFGIEVKGRNAYEDQRRFETPSDALAFYTRVTGKVPVEKESWGFGSDKGGRWGLRFRGTRPADVPLPPPLKPKPEPVPEPEAPYIVEYKTKQAALREAYLEFLKTQPLQRVGEELNEAL